MINQFVLICYCLPLINAGTLIGFDPISLDSGAMAVHFNFFFRSAVPAADMECFKSDYLGYPTPPNLDLVIYAEILAMECSYQVFTMFTQPSPTTCVNSEIGEIYIYTNQMPSVGAEEEIVYQFWQEVTNNGMLDSMQSTGTCNFSNPRELTMCNSLKQILYSKAEEIACAAAACLDVDNIPIEAESYVVVCTTSHRVTYDVFDAPPFTPGSMSQSNCPQAEHIYQGAELAFLGNMCCAYQVISTQNDHGNCEVMKRFGYCTGPGSYRATALAYCPKSCGEALGYC